MKPTFFAVILAAFSFGPAFAEGQSLVFNGVTYELTTIAHLCEDFDGNNCGDEPHRFVIQNNVVYLIGAAPHFDDNGERYLVPTAWKVEIMDDLGPATAGLPAGMGFADGAS